MKKRLKKKKSKTVSLCGIPYKLLYFPGMGDKGRNCEEDIIGYIDNDKREIHLEKGRGDTGYILFHELVHGAIEALVVPGTPLFNKYYGEGFVRPFARILWGMLQDSGLVTVKKM